MRLSKLQWEAAKWLIASLWAVGAYAQSPGGSVGTVEKIIIDTDIGTDIDDAFAVALALQSSEVKVLGIAAESGDTVARARILDRLLGETSHSDIPVLVGRTTVLPYYLPSVGRQSRYGRSGRFGRSSHVPAVEFLLEQIRLYPGQITLVAIGPVTNLGDAIDRDPATFRHLKRVVMMGGSIGAVDSGGWGSNNQPTPESNIWMDVKAAQKLFAAGVPIFMMPLDSTASLKLDEAKRETLFSEGTPLTDSLGVLYLMWAQGTPVLSDAMAIGFVIDPHLCPVEPMHIVVSEEGVTRSEPGEANAEVCLHSDPDQFFHFYMPRLK